jgi:hypothetical protein
VGEAPKDLNGYTKAQHVALHKTLAELASLYDDAGDVVEAGEARRSAFWHQRQGDKL